MCHILQATTWKAELQETIQMDLRELGLSTGIELTWWWMTWVLIQFALPDSQ